MSSPFQPTRAQATTGRPVRGISTMPTIGGELPMEQMPSHASSTAHFSGKAASFAQPTNSKTEGAFTHEQRGGSAPTATTQGINVHDTVPHMPMHGGLTTPRTFT